MLKRPRQTKYNKSQADSLSYTKSSFKNPSYGKFALYALEAAYIKFQQLETGRQVIKRHMKKKGIIWVRVFPDFPYSSKPAETRMGKGKGNIEEWLCRVQKGKILYEVDGCTEENIEKGLRAAQKKLPLKTFIYKTFWKNKTSYYA